MLAGICIQQSYEVLIEYASFNYVLKTEKILKMLSAHQLI